MGLKVNPSIDKVCVDGKKIVARMQNEVLWVVVNKPRGVITSTEDEKGRKSVMDLVPLAKERRLLPVGRLDRDSGGLLLLTNDNEAINLLTHPTFGHVKSYKVVVKGFPAEHVYQSFARGVVLPEERRPTVPMEMEQLDYLADKKETVLRLGVKEGSSRLIRRMFDYFGHEVKYLTRMSFGSIKLGELRVGEWRKLTTPELFRLRGTLNSYKKKAEVMASKKRKKLTKVEEGGRGSSSSRDGKERSSPLSSSKPAASATKTLPPLPKLGTVLAGGRGFGAAASSSSSSSRSIAVEEDDDVDVWEEDSDVDDDDDDFDGDDDEEEEEWE